jgi:hypothetical protein
VVIQPRLLPILTAAAFALLALALTLLGGIRHDYVYYLAQWDLVLSGADPWSTNNAYGPLHNGFALLVGLHLLAPKLLTALSLIVANTLLVQRLAAQRGQGDWLPNYLIVFAGNLLVLICAFWFGLNDGLVAALVIGAVLARLDGRMLLAGVLLGLATLDKFYPALLIPFFAIDARRIEPRLIIAALLTTLIGLLIAVGIWGSAWFEAVAFGVSRDARILSIIRPITVLGRALGIGDITDLLVRFNGPLVVLVWLGAIAIAWQRRDNWLTSACWGFFAVLLTYKAGNPQFWVPWLGLVAALPLLHLPAADRLARLSWPFASFLALYQIGYAVLRADLAPDSFTWINLIIGIPAFLLGVALLSLWFRDPANRPASA